MEFTTIKGFKDILPQEVGNWQMLESTARSIFESFGYHEIKTPLLERTELFSRGIGLDTDIVSKEMYTFEDSKGRGMTLRPEATASVVRAYIQQRLYIQNPIQKLFCIGPMFRHERPQKGRFRQFHQINAEFFGDSGPKSDADMIVMAMYLFESIGLDDLSLNINSLGCPQCRPGFREELKGFLSQKTDLLCADCRRRSETNPLRVFDCKVEGCRQVVRDAPSILESLCNNCKDHFEALQGYLERSGIPFVLNHRLVRGLDYYNKTTFEIQTERLGAQNAVAGGGRYDGLLKLLGGPDHPATGFAVGMERVIALLEEKGTLEPKRPDLFIAALGKTAEELSFDWAASLRKAGLWVEMDYGSKGLKSQMKKAGRLGARKVLIAGEDELASGKGVLRDMETKEQVDVEIEDIVNRLKKFL
ncbi:MAG: histidine--tRNA ligase [Deltaproteobacteria bacterium]|nr:histidine--tRNA ligase [Deltaproteobacteria bacterium]MBW2116931.1 histidine--tRNA ligase [Deltaproteobacteria bacterium]MBW2345350.1 histidine--tRNA ligase [Deltaproteobacteria bacterium]